MDAEAVNAQIKQMVAFIQQEAEEKALELSTRANEERAIERARLLQEAKVCIRLFLRACVRGAVAHSPSPPAGPHRN